MSSRDPAQNERENEEEDAMLDPEEAEEEIEDDGDIAMDSGDEDEVIPLQNDSAAHFDGHTDSIFCIAQHPANPAIVATGGGDDVAYIFDSTPEPSPLLPRSYESDPQPRERKSLERIAKLDGHTDSVNAIAFTLPKGEYVATAGLDGQLRVYHNASLDARTWTFLASASEVEEINWLAACPSPSHPNALALGASDGSVWVYELNAADANSPLTIAQAYYLHTGPSTAGAWTPDGNLLATVSEDSSFYVWDVWGEAAAAGVATPGTQHIVGLTGEDDRFAVEGGLYSVAISPGGTLAAVGGAGGLIRVVGLPKLGAPAAGKPAKGAKGAAPAGGQMGQILASLQANAESVESLSFSDPPLTLLAAGGVDSTIAIFDVARRFAIRRKIEDAHEGEAVIRAEFVKAGAGGKNGWLLTTAGNDGVIRSGVSLVFDIPLN
ncbi:WD40 repeat-like protein [Trichodelitschia bisporula]|uniref:WD40 repeat-like protein n=1 Tax=Trichodelitschia bisporula TaxID=703511 RepID=A0A6G1HPR5_9PEZI|nr:WD40 repeat-like protein [Trichodelitschia bisporula]